MARASIHYVSPSSDNDEITLRTPLSGTFLQTLPDLVTYATEGALFISARRGQRPPKGSGTNMTVEAA